MTTNQQYPYGYGDNSTVFTNNTITGNAGVGFRISNPSPSNLVTISATGNLVTGSSDAVLIDHTATGDGSVSATFHGNSLTGYTTFAVDNQNTASGNVFDFSKNWFGTNVLAMLLTVINDPSTEVDFTPFLDTGVPVAVTPTGFQGDFTKLHVTADGAQVGSTGRIQEGVNDVAGTGALTVVIENGTYVESNITITQAMTVEGASESGVVIGPSIVDDHLDSSFAGTVSNGFVIESSGVTIETLTLDGDAGIGGAGSQNFRSGIIVDGLNSASAYDNTTVDSVTFKNLYRRGVMFYFNVAGVHSTGNEIKNSTFDTIGTSNSLGFESPFAIIAFDADASIHDNVITNVGGGIGSNFVVQPSDAPLLTIYNNQISNFANRTLGSLGMDLSGMRAGSWVHDNTVDMTGDTTGLDIGIVVQYAAGSATVEHNTITADAGDTGIYVFFDDPGTVLLKNNSVTGNGDGLGILVTDNGDRFGQPGDGATSATLIQNSVSGFSTGTGIEVQQLNVHGDNLAASAIIGDGTNANANTVHGNATDILVTGSLASHHRR